MQEYKRDQTVDVLRFLAIFVMVMGHTAVYLFSKNSPPPRFVEYAGGIAPPLFVLLSGMMVAYSAAKKNRPFKYFLLRGIVILFMGVMIDVHIWNIYPFMTVDILYLIGISIPVAFLFCRLQFSGKWLIVVAIFLLTPVLQKTLGYSDYPLEIYLDGTIARHVANQTSVLNHWIIDGWFPIFPWLGMALLGTYFYEIRYRRLPKPNFGKAVYLYAALVLFIIGYLIWPAWDGTINPRLESGGVFMPPTLGYLVTSIGVILLLFFIIDLKPTLPIYKPLGVLGESALVIYGAHLFILKFGIKQIFEKRELIYFLAVFSGFFVLLILIAYFVRLVKIRWKDKPLILRIILGGGK